MESCSRDKISVGFFSKHSGSVIVNDVAPWALGNSPTTLNLGKFSRVCATAFSFSLKTKMKNDSYTHPDILPGVWTTEEPSRCGR
jgi:hypothetical protein